MVDSELLGDIVGSSASQLPARRRLSLNTEEVPASKRREIKFAPNDQVAASIRLDEDDEEDEIVLRSDSCWSRWTRPMKRKAPCMSSNSLFIFSPENKVRALLFNVTNHKIFESLVMLHIFANCIFLALNDPKTDSEPYQDAADYYFIAAFTVEMLMKVAANGLALHKGAYLRNPWNVLDGSIVCLSYLGLIPGVANLTALRTIRVLRPLRSMNAVAGLRVIVSSLMHSVGGLVHVIVLLGLCFCIFGILGVQLWKGLYRMRCRDITTQEWFPDVYCRAGAGDSLVVGYSCPANQVCEPYANAYNNYLNFDSFPQALLVMFTFMTFEDWTEHLVITYNVFGQPSFIYFFFFIIFCSYFVPNLALAVINEKFVEAHEKMLAREEAILEEEELREKANTDTLARKRRESILQRDSVINPLRGSQNETLNASGDGTHSDLECEGYFDPELAAYETRHTFELACFAGLCWRPCCKSRGCRAVNTVRDWMFLHIEGYDRPLSSEQVKDTPPITIFGAVVLIAIILNTLVLASQHHLQPDWLTGVQDVANLVLTVVFLVEMVLKVFALGVCFYLQDPFNVVDGITTLLAVVELPLENASFVSVFRAFRLLRVLKLLRNLKSIRKILRVLLSAMKDTGFLSLIVLLYLFIAALVGMQLFGASMEDVATSDNPVRTNFSTFFRSFIAVFTVLTRDEWVRTMLNAAAATSPAAVLYFIALVLIGDYLILNLFLAILIGAFEEDDINELLAGEYSEDGDTTTQGTNYLNVHRLRRRGMRSDGSERKSIQEEPATPVASAPPDFNPDDIIYINAPMAKIIHRAKQLAERRRHLRLQRDRNDETRDLLQQSTLGLSVYPDQGRELDSFAISVTRPAPEDDLASVSNSLASMASRGVFSMPSQSRISRTVSRLKEDLDATRVSVCERCGTLKQAALEAAPLVTRRTVDQVHGYMCAAIATRRSKERVVAGLLEYVESQMRLKEPPTQEQLEILLGQAWSSGLLLSDMPDDLVGPESDWTRVEAALRMEMAVLELKVGEEQVGRGLLAYTAACVPREIETNGGVSLFVWGDASAFRKGATALVQNPYFDRFILVLIFLSSICLALDNPKWENGFWAKETLLWVDVVFTAAFVFEMCAKIVALGFALHERAYLRDPWNWLDFLIVIVSVVSLAAQDVGLGYLKVLRTFRGLRPLRVITHNRALKIVVRALFKSLKGIANVAMICGFNYVVFGILGVQLFSGSFYRCTDESVTTRVNCTGTYIDASNATAVRYWKNAERNYDNLLQAMLTLFEVSCLEWWPPVMWDSVDHVDYDNAPEANRNILYALFYVVFITIASFILLNMFVGVVISNFNSVKNHMDGVSLLTDEQRMWVDTQRLMLTFSPQPLLHAGAWKLSRLCHRVVTHFLFDVFIGIFIVGNTVVLAIDHYGQPDAMETALGWANDAFSILFIVECVLKLLAFELRYFSDDWNKFDFFLVIMSLVNFSLRAVQDSVNINILQVFRVLRILRVVRRPPGTQGAHPAAIPLLLAAVARQHRGAYGAALFPVLRDWGAGVLQHRLG